MNLTLHWLRRDFRRHAPLIALWALLVALFTWARIWFRTHPEVMLGDRDLSKNGVEVDFFGGRTRMPAGPAILASPLLSEVFSSARTLLGHSDVHIRNSLGNLAMLHLVRINDEKGTGKRVTFAFFPWNWHRGDGCIIRLVAITNPDQAYRIEKGEAF
mgnify:CR=1 FL=1